MKYFSYKKVHVFSCGFFVFLVSLDQLIKYYVVHKEQFDFLCNYGVAFGLVLPQYVFLILWSLIMVFVFYFWFTKRKAMFLTQLPFILVGAGGISNMIDRIYYGCVVDYVPFLTISSFNFADVLISFGAFLWVRQIFLERKVC